MLDLGRMGPRLVGAAALGVGLTSLFITAIGLYGVTAFLSSRRTTEIGIRMALAVPSWGAARVDLVAARRQDG